MTDQVPAGAHDAWQRLDTALATAEHHARPIPCRSDPETWWSHDCDDRQRAAAACAGCPVVDACRAYAAAAREPDGVWGAVDRSREPREPAPPRPTLDVDRVRELHREGRSATDIAAELTVSRATVYRVLSA